MAIWTTGARSLSTVMALGALVAGSATAQTSTLTASDSAALCAVSTKTGKWTKTDDTMTESARKDMCAKRRAARTRTSSGGEVATSSMRIPVSKEPAPAPVAAAPEPMPAPMPVAPAPEPPPVVTETVVTITPAPVDTATPAPSPMLVPKRYGNGFYIGLGGGAGLPTEALREGYDPGMTAVVPIGWDSPDGPLGFRVNLGYTRLAARNQFRSTGLTTGINNGSSSSAVATTDPQIYSAMADLKLRMPFLGHFGGNSGSGLYVIGGGGVNHFRNYDRSIERTNPEFKLTDVGTVRETSTQGAWNAGAGLSVGVHNTAIFLESRYVSLMTDHSHASFVPITLGVTFY